MIPAVRSTFPGGSVTATLLAIDDSKTMRKVIEITFAGENYRTVISPNASDALAKLRSERPAIVLLDAILGDSNGYEICQRIKAEAPSVGVIILSSKQHPYDRTRGTAAGADDFIDKPFDTQAMIDKVAGLLHRLGDAAAHPPAQQPVPPRPIAAPAAAVPAQRQQTTVSFSSADPSAAAPKPSVPARASIPTVTAAAPAAAVAATALGSTNLESKLQGLGLTREQVAGVLAISKDLLEQVVWEVVPVLAETLIREEIQRLTAD
jgi:CheY-like chemotaxis protein